jgi:hypothetical protein
MLLEFIVQFFLEFILEVFGGLIFDGIFHGLSRIPWLQRSINAVSALLLFFVLGVTTGFLSLLVLPNSLIKSSTVHGINLLITPTLVGLTMALVGWLRRRKGKFVTPLETFAYGFLFAFGMALVRFYLTD